MKNESYLSNEINLTKEEERKLYYSNDPYDLGKLVEAHMPLVEFFVRKFFPPDLQDELRSEGRMGIIKGLKKYDPEKAGDNYIRTYIVYWVKSYIFRAAKSLENQMNEVHWDYEDFDKMEDFCYVPHRDFMNNDLKQYIIDNGVDEVLTDEEKDIILKYYGLRGNEKVSQKSIASEYERPKSWVSDKHNKALKKLYYHFVYV